MKKDTKHTLIFLGLIALWILFTIIIIVLFPFSSAEYIYYASLCSAIGFVGSYAIKLDKYGKTYSKIKAEVERLTGGVPNQYSSQIERNAEKKYRKQNAMIAGVAGFLIGIVVTSIDRLV
jgi:hypothetical protein